MADKNNNVDIDNDAENEEQQQIPSDRGLPSISKNKRSGAGGVGQKVVLAIIAILVILALIGVNGGFSGKEEKKQTTQSKEDSVANLLGPAPDLPPPPAPPKSTAKESDEDTMVHTNVAPPPPSSASTGARKGKEEPTPEERKRTKSLLAFGDISKPAKSSAEDGSNGNGEAVAVNAERDSSLREDDTADSLNKRLKGTQIDGTRASVMRDRSFFITQGTFLGCSLETAISSDVPGMVSCRLTQDVYSTDNKVLLLEHGSKVVGQYQGGVQRGQSRIFVLWTRVETPNGVIVKLDSPGADGLGRSGLDGFLDKHFWDRFGAAIMLSTIDNGGEYLANKASGGNKNGNTQFNFGGTTDTAKDMAGIALENDVNIPNTLVKNQGDRINIYVARDLDFRGAYALQPK
ncbi:type IV secretion system protein VirB10 [Erwinia amylovora]|uniref:type IV secretion system protein VirB10 n=1 Tax=Erwinia amylovora TaxID=552 RepID=UPI0020BF0EBA|nr:type IV secretion system protein VirB10 [Erwinia amylovora]MCK8373824.1 type IV secretion system protein VirB10 [Erwinia amylovora]